jgi:ParB family transcriptional regulator, chromosome partitioning protein
MPPEKSARRLGRGLDALFSAPAAPSASAEDTALRDIATSQIVSNPFQPRKNFKPQDLKELRESLQTSGLLQPITVRPSPKTANQFELVAGERRLRAATSLGWKKIPAVVKNLTDQEILTLALIENLQRSDLNPIEEAEGYSQLINQFGRTQQTVATMVGKDRSTIANVLRILQLPPDVRQLLTEGQLTAGQARPLLALDDTARITALAREIVVRGLSAREVERQVRLTGPDQPKSTKGRPKKADVRPAEIKNLEQSLRKHFQTDVEITIKKGNRGTVNVSFYSPDDLERVLEIMGMTNNPH